MGEIREFPEGNGAKKTGWRLYSDSLFDAFMIFIGLSWLALAIIAFQSDISMLAFQLLLASAITLVACSRATKRFTQPKSAKRLVQVAGGVKIRPSSTKLLLISAWLILFGPACVSAAYLHDGNWAIVGIGILVLVFGIFLMLGFALGKFPVGFLKFEHQGLTIGYRAWSVLVPWENVAQVSLTDPYENSILCLCLFDPTAVHVQPLEKVADFRKVLAANQDWGDVDLIVMLSIYPFDVNDLLIAIQRYVTDPRARAELVQGYIGTDRK